MKCGLSFTLVDNFKYIRRKNILNHKKIIPVVLFLYFLAFIFSVKIFQIIYTLDAITSLNPGHLLKHNYVKSP